jgi:hypothetical protein
VTLMRRGTLLLAATMTVLLWLLAGCAGDDQQQELAGAESDGGGQQQNAQESERSASGMSRLPTENSELVEGLEGKIAFASSYINEIWTMNANGTNLTQLS